MNVLHLIGFTSSILIGVSLGLIGGGGSILTLPVLVYLMGINPILSTAYSLFVVGTTSFVGAVRYMQKALVNYRLAIVISLPSLLAVYLTRAFLIPHIPDPIIDTPGFLLSQGRGLMLLFALVMLAASIAMIRKPAPADSQPDGPINYWFMLVPGALVGILTGLVGAGGGFLLIPALVLLARVPMKTAVGTSLLMIGANSLFGFLNARSLLLIDWTFLLPFTAFAVAGTFLGVYLSRFIPGQQLRRSFGWFVRVLGVSIITKEVLF